MQEIYSPNKNYFDLIIKDFGEKINFFDIDKLINEYLYVTYITLQYIQETLDEDIYNELKEIRVEYIEDIKDKVFFGYYDPNKQMIVLNSKYFGYNVNDNDKDQVKEDTFADTIMHEIGHYCLIRDDNIEIVKELYDKDENYRNQLEQFSDDDLRSLDKDKRIHELHARAFSARHRDILYKNNKI